MPNLDALLECCRIQGTSCKEHGGRIFVRQEQGETIRLYRIDEHSNPRCTLRQSLGMIEGGICDCLFVYEGQRRSTQVYCLVEMKGGNISRAVKQVENTHYHLSQHVDRTVVWRCYILIHGSAPQQLRQYRDRLLERFGKGNVEIKRDPNIGTFLRK